MSPLSVSVNKILSKFQALDEYLRYLKELQKINRKSFLNDYHAFGLTEHYLHLSVEVLIDTAKLIIISFGFPRPEEPRDAFRVLFEKKVINKKIYNQLSGISGFRNVLIHEYEKINKELIFNYLQKNIGQFEEYKKQVFRFLKKKKSL